LAGWSFFHVRFGGFDNESLFYCAGGDADITNFAIYHRFDPLQIGHKAPLGNRGDVGPNAPLFLDLPLRQMNAAFNRPFAREFTILAIEILCQNRAGKLTCIGALAKPFLPSSCLKLQLEIERIHLYGLGQAPGQAGRAVGSVYK